MTNLFFTLIANATGFGAVAIFCRYGNSPKTISYIAVLNFIAACAIISIAT